MYNGRLDLKESSYRKMYETAETLQMSVLTKLMDAQVTLLWNVIVISLNVFCDSDLAPVLSL